MCVRVAAIEPAVGTADKEVLAEHVSALKYGKKFGVRIAVCSVGVQFDFGHGEKDLGSD